MLAQEAERAPAAVEEGDAAVDDVAAAAAPLAEGVAELRAAAVELRPRPRAVAVDDRGAVGEDVPACAEWGSVAPNAIEAATSSL